MRIMTRRFRRFTALFALVGMLFAHLAVAAYVCPMAGGVEEAAGSQPMDRGCGGMAMDAEQPALCQAHCHQGDQSLDKPIVAAPEQPAGTLAVVPGAFRAEMLVAAPGEQQSLLDRATAPPAALRHCCLRI